MAMDWSVTSSLVLCLAAGVVGGVATQHSLSFHVAPKEIILGSERTSRLHLNCYHSEERNIQEIEIGKLLPGNVQRKMVTLRPWNRAPSIEDESLRRRMRTSGTITEHGGHIDIDLYQLICGDAAQYYCMSVLYDHDGHFFVSNSVTVRANPQVPYMRVTPHDSTYSIGLDLHLKCSGRVGSELGPGRQLWRWDWRGPDKSSPWTEYPYHGNITNEHPTPDPTSPCEFTSSSTLIHTVNKEDDGRLIRCSVVDPKYSDLVTIHVDQEFRAHNYTFIVAISVVCGMCSVLVLFVFGFILIRSLRNNKAPTQVVVIPKYEEHQRIQFVTLPKQSPNTSSDNVTKGHEIFHSQSDI